MLRCVTSLEKPEKPEKPLNALAEESEKPASLLTKTEELSNWEKTRKPHKTPKPKNRNF